MSSPLSSFYNTLLYIPGRDTTGVDDVGNTILVPGTEVEYKAYLKRSTKDPSVGYSVGVDNSKQYFKGYIVEPLNLPDGLILPATVRAKKRRGHNDLWNDGTFEILPEFLPIDIVEDVLGDAIGGWFLSRK
ncbi:MAG: hypothetical protein ACRC2S_28545 [Waterburya sp.]